MVVYFNLWRFAFKLKVGFVASICSKLSDTVSSEVGKVRFPA